MTPPRASRRCGGAGAPRPGGAGRCGRGARWRRCGAGRCPPPLPAPSLLPVPSAPAEAGRSAAWRRAAAGRRLGAPLAWRSGRSARPRGSPWRCGAGSTAPPAGSWRCAGPVCSSAPSAPSPPPSGWRPTASSCSARYEAGRTRAPGAAPGGPCVPPAGVCLVEDGRCWGRRASARWTAWGCAEGAKPLRRRLSLLSVRPWQHRLQKQPRNAEVLAPVPDPYYLTRISTEGPTARRRPVG